MKRERTREEIEAAMAKAREASWESFLSEQRRYYNFDYRRLWERIRQQNHKVIQGEDDQVVLEDFVSESKARSRAVDGRSYEDWVRLAFYAHLTVMRRIRQNWFSEIGQAQDTPPFLKFSLLTFEQQCDQVWKQEIKVAIIEEKAMWAEV